jgi:hypothetical protein
VLALDGDGGDLVGLDRLDKRVKLISVSRGCCFVTIDRRSIEEQ